MENNTLKKSAENVLVITRIFNAPVKLVWKAWTDPKHLMQWWGPKNFTSPSCKIDFREGGKYLYCMGSAEGKEFYSTGTYLEIIPFEKIACTDSFSDEQGNIISPSQYGMGEDFPQELLLTLLFEAQDGKTKFTLRHEGMPVGEMSDMTSASWNELLDKLTETLK